MAKVKVKCNEGEDVANDSRSEQAKATMTGANGTRVRDAIQSERLLGVR